MGNLTRRHSTFLVAFVVIVAVVVGAGLYLNRRAKADGTLEFPREWYFYQTSAQVDQHAPLLGQQMPQLSLSRFTNADASPGNLKGNIIVLDFWATWCGPCIAAIPHNNELYSKYRARGVEFLGICTSQGQERFDAVFKLAQPKYPQACDPTLAAQEQWHVMWYPTYAVVDRVGRVRAIGLKPQYIESVIQKLLAE